MQQSLDDDVYDADVQVDPSSLYLRDVLRTQEDVSNSHEDIVQCREEHRKYDCRYSC